MQDPYRPATGYPAPPYNYPNSGQPPPPGTAYPYAAPPPYAQQQYYNLNRYGNRVSQSFVRSFLAALICFVVIIGVISIIVWLVLRPSLPDFQVDSLSLTNFSANSQSVSGTWKIGFLVRNGNKKMTVTYNSLASSVFYKSVYLSETQLAPFKQDTKSQTTLNATLSTVNTYVEGRFVGDINGERARGSVAFDVKVMAYTSFRSGAWRSRTRLLRVFCGKVPVGISSNSSSGNLVGGARDCQVW